MCAPVVCATLQMDNPDTGEEWRGFILTVVKVSNHMHIFHCRILCECSKKGKMDGFQQLELVLWMP